MGKGQASLPWSALWIPASAISGALNVVISYVLSNTPVLPSGGDDAFLEHIVPDPMGQGISGAAYGAVTGVVLALIIRMMA